MSDDQAPPRRWVFPTPPTPGGLTHRELTLTGDDVLTLVGHDLGGTSWGTSEYEFRRMLRPDDTGRLRKLLEVTPDADLLGVLAARFATSVDLETFLLAHDLPGEFSSRVGD